MNHKHFRLSEANPDGGAGGGNPENNQDPNKNGGGKGGSGSGDGDEGDGKNVSYESHQRLLREKKQEQEKRKAAETELETLRNEKAERDRKKLEEEGNFKALLEQREKELNDEKARNATIVGEITDARKKRAILKHIQGVVPEGAHQLLNLSLVELDADGKPTEQTAKAAAQLFQKEHPYAIQTDKKGGGLPNEEAAGGIGGKKIIYSEWCKLSAADMKKQYGNVDWSTAPNQ
jgi:hypothetical protein